MGYQESDVVVFVLVLFDLRFDLVELIRELDEPLFLTQVLEQGLVGERNAMWHKPYFIMRFLLLRLLNHVLLQYLFVTVLWRLVLHVLAAVSVFN